ncbi:glycosyltransferase [Arhodomonas aquaeolei]|uniref:glycosyltransferase n=1 Tax=Arhodomonas aquaeolei TaxID=2369 RepID=UPI0021698729|nr:glycosyltransferase [Arhodomonas aquaeolei]MCS4503034.1 glycosyltransferase [Arhodomonas aquaeolei]
MNQPVDIALFGMISRHPGRNQGGVSVSVQRLANALDAQGLEILVVTAETSCRPEWRAGLNPGVRLAACQRLSRWRLTLQLTAILRRHRPRALIAFDQRAGLIAAAAGRFPGIHSPLFWSPRIAIGPQVAGGGRSARRVLAGIRRIHASARGIIAISQGMAAELGALTGIPASSITTIYNPIVDGALEQKANEPAPGRFDLPEDTPLLVASGRMTPQKDYPTLLRAVAWANRRTPLSLLILGEGPERPALEALSRELGLVDRVAMPGHLANPFPVMRQADTFVLSSRYEGFGNVLAEALALGLPVAATDCPFGPREILADGRYGTLVPVGDSEALAEAIATTLEHPPPPEHQRAGAARFETGRIARQYRDTVLGPPGDPT